MKVFKDKERGLDWVSFEKAKEEKCKEALVEINAWSGTPNIDRFIVDGMPCGDFLTRLYANSNPAFMDMVGVKQPEKVEDFLYFLYTEENPNEVAGITYLNNKKIEDELAVEYLVINPKLQGKGIGTRFIQSLKDNMKTLSKRDSNKVLTTIVDKENKPSIKLFSKICKPVESREIIGNTGKFWYFSSREMGKEN